MESSFFSEKIKFENLLNILARKDNYSKCENIE